MKKIIIYLSFISLFTIFPSQACVQEEKEAVNNDNAVNPKDFLAPMSDLQKPGLKDLQERIMQGVMGDIADLHKKDEQLYRLGLINRGNWHRYEQIAFNWVDVQNFAKQAIADECKNAISEEEVIQCFELDTTIGRMRFRKTMNAGMPELLVTGKCKEAFNSTYLYAKDEILHVDLSITQLKIEGKVNLGILPRRIGRLTNLKKLDLRYNLLKWLPAELGNLTNLEELCLCNNQLTAVPAELGLLTNLVLLDLGSNHLTALPEKLGKLTNLKTLHLYYNWLTSLFAGIGQLTKLGSLDLTNCHLTSVPAELGLLTNLEKLFIHVNRLASLPAELGSLTKLKTLSLSDNQLTSLPAEFGKLTDLKSIFLANNPLPTLPDSLSPANKPGLWIDGFKGSFVPPK